MATLEEAIIIAARAHRGMVDKGGAPYILHPLRMMLRLKTPAERIAAVLHDVVEDSDWTLDDLRAAGFSEEIVAAVDHLTRRAGEPYMAFIRRAAAHPVARRVKMADLEDNLDRTRLATITPRDEARLAKYERALALLREDAAGADA